ncbi:MAG: hypothetical protein AAGA33_01710 [Pseudomonadota bacterium]
MHHWPRFISIVTIALGSYDLIRGVVHTVLFGSVAAGFAGLDLAGPTGRDQLVLMAAFGSSNFITGAALIYLGFNDRVGALVLMAIIPVALLTAGASITYWGGDLIGQGIFPGRRNMAVYVVVCVVTVIASLWMRRRPMLRY